MPSDVEKNAERLLPGKTEQAVRKIHAERRAAAAKKGNKELVARLDRALPVRLQRLKSQGANVFKVSPERLLPGKTLQEVEAVYKQRRASAVSKGRTALVQALDRAIAVRRKQLGGSSGKVPPPPGKVPSSPGKTPVPSGKEWKDVFGPVDMSNPNPRAVSEKYQALRKRTKDEDVSKLNALFKKAIVDIKLIKRQRAAQESKSAEGAEAKIEADRARVEAEKVKAKTAEAKKSIEREIISTKRKIRDVSIKAKKASANIDRAGKEMSAATARRDTRKAEKLTRFSRKRQQNLSSARQTREKLITSLKGLEQKSAKVSSTPLMLTQGSPKPLARQSAQQQSVQQQKSSQIQAKAQQFLAEKARAQSAKIEQSGKQLVIKAAQNKMEQVKRQQSAKAQSAQAQSAQAQSAKLEQEKRQKSAKLEQDKRQQLARVQSSKLEQVKKQQMKVQSTQKRQMSQARPQKTMRIKRR